MPARFHAAQKTLRAQVAQEKRHAFEQAIPAPFSLREGIDPPLQRLELANRARQAIFADAKDGDRGVDPRDVAAQCILTCAPGAQGDALSDGRPQTGKRWLADTQFGHDRRAACRPARQQAHELVDLCRLRHKSPYHE